MQDPTLVKSTGLTLKASASRNLTIHACSPSVFCLLRNVFNVSCPCQDLPPTLWPSYNFLENAALVSQSLKRGAFAYDSRHSYSHQVSDDFIDVVLGQTQAPEGCWDPEWAAKGLIPHINDVRYLLNRSYSRKFCDM